MAFGEGVTTYITKVWGFGVPAGPLQFPTPGWRENAQSVLKPGDLVVLVGTQGEETDPEEQGRLLGIMEPTRHVVRSLDFDLRQAAADFNEAGAYKWPYALHNHRAWILIDRPLLREISARKFAMNAVQGIVALDAGEAARVTMLRRREVSLLQPRAQAISRMARADRPARKVAPPPVATTRAGVMHLRRAAAYTYLMRIEGAEPAAYKIGWAFDPKRRCREFNHVSIPSLGGHRYELEMTQLWDRATEAFHMEQAILRRLDAYRSPANNEVIVGLGLPDITRAWFDYLGRNL